MEGKISTQARWTDWIKYIVRTKLYCKTIQINGILSSKQFVLIFYLTNIDLVKSLLFKII